MLGGHGQNYFNEAVALAIACIPVLLLVACLVVSLFERKPRRNATADAQRARTLARFSRVTDDRRSPISVR